MNNEAIFNWQLNVECPGCKDDIDLSDDPDFAEWIFTNKWDKLEGEEVYCGNCDEYIEITEVVM